MERKHTYSVFEKNIFLQILKKYSSIIENKKTDGATLRDKTIAWQKITQEFNSHTIQPATTKQLRRFWANLKQKQRNAITVVKQHRMATGGGPPVKDAEIDPDIEDITNNLIVGIDDAIDSDTQPGLIEDNDSVIPFYPSDKKTSPFHHPSENSILPSQTSTTHTVTSMTESLCDTTPLDNATSTSDLPSLSGSTPEQSSSVHRTLQATSPIRLQTPTVPAITSTQLQSSPNPRKLLVIRPSSIIRLKPPSTSTSSLPTTKPTCQSLSISAVTSSSPPICSVTSHSLITTATTQAQSSTAHNHPTSANNPTSPLSSSDHSHPTSLQNPRRTISNNREDTNTRINARQRFNVLEREYQDRYRRQEELHNIQIRIMSAQLREAEAKAELAELILRQHKAGQK